MVIIIEELNKGPFFHTFLTLCSESYTNVFLSSPMYSTEISTAFFGKLAWAIYS